MDNQAGLVRKSDHIKKERDFFNGKSQKRRIIGQEH